MTQVQGVPDCSKCLPSVVCRISRILLWVFVSFCGGSKIWVIWGPFKRHGGLPKPAPCPIQETTTCPNSHRPSTHVPRPSSCPAPTNMQQNTKQHNKQLFFGRISMCATLSTAVGGTFQVLESPQGEGVDIGSTASHSCTKEYTIEYSSADELRKKAQHGAQRKSGFQRRPSGPTNQDNSVVWPKRGQHPQHNKTNHCYHPGNLNRHDVAKFDGCAEATGATPSTRRFAPPRPRRNYTQVTVPLWGEGLQRYMDSTQTTHRISLRCRHLSAPSSTGKPCDLVS